MTIVRATSHKLPSFTRQETKKGKNKRKATEKKQNSCPWCAPIPFHLLMELTSSPQSNRISTITNYPILFAENCVSMYILILATFLDSIGFNEAVIRLIGCRQFCASCAYYFWFWRIFASWRLKNSQCYIHKKLVFFLFLKKRPNKVITL